MDQMHLKMNPTKTEFILFGSRHQLSKCCTRNIKVIEETVTQRPVVKYLGAWLDNNLSFKQHVLNRCKFAICSIYKLMHIRRFIDQKNMQDSGIQFGAVTIKLCKCIAPRNKQL